MDCEDIITEKLKELGADGLYKEDLDCEENCGCGLDNLCHCRDGEYTDWLDCVPAKKTDDGFFVPLNNEG